MPADFDILAFAHRMEAAGFTRAEAEALASEQARLIDERLATKTDIEQLRLSGERIRADLARDIEQLRQETRTSIEQLRQETRTSIEQLRQEMQLSTHETRSSIELLRQDMQLSTHETRSSIELLRRDLVIRLGSIVIASVAAGSTAVTLLSHLH